MGGSGKRIQVKRLAWRLPHSLDVVISLHVLRTVCLDGKATRRDGIAHRMTPDADLAAVSAKFFYTGRWHSLRAPDLGVAAPVSFLARHVGARMYAQAKPVQTDGDTRRAYG